MEAKKFGTSLSKDSYRRMYTRHPGWIAAGVWGLSGFVIIGVVYGMMASLGLADPPVFILVSP